MLDPWIIEEIKRREEERHERGVQQVELPLIERRDYCDTEPGTRKPEPEVERGVVVIDL